MKIIVYTAAAITLCATYLTAQDTDTPVTNLVRSERGLVRGQTIGGVDRFLGIPYAAPPVGDLRWKDPIPPQRWYGVRDATVPGSECPQLVAAKDGQQTVAGSEDCLYLNVYRPARAGRRLLPVLVFIHGGSNIKGSGDDYDPSEMVNNTGIIVVTINYRLNVFGFLALPSLDTEANDRSSGNFGVLDQQAALRWVRENILGFGGNPSNVTVEGESAGGIDLCAQLVSPLAAGLFSRAILESAYCPTAPHDEAIQTSAPVAAALGCTDAATAAVCLRAKPAADVLQAAAPLSHIPGGATIVPGKGSGFNSSPNFGNHVLPVKPADALASGRWNWSPVLIGSNHDEAALFVGPALIAKRVKLPLSAEAYQQIVASRYGSFAPAVLNEYPLDQYPDPFFAYADQVTDYSPLGCQISTLSRSFSALSQTFRFEFDDPAAPVPGGGSAGTPAGMSLGAYHGSELQYLFQMAQLPGPATDSQKQLSAQMMQYWANFVKTGNPNGPGLPDWPRYSAGSQQILLLRPEGNVVIDNFDTDHHCGFWATAPGPPFNH